MEEGRCRPEANDGSSISTGQASGTVLQAFAAGIGQGIRPSAFGPELIRSPQDTGTSVRPFRMEASGRQVARAREAGAPVQIRSSLPAVARCRPRLRRPSSEGSWRCASRWCHRRAGGIAARGAHLGDQFVPVHQSLNRRKAAGFSFLTAVQPLRLVRARVHLGHTRPSGLIAERRPLMPARVVRPALETQVEAGSALYSVRNRNAETAARWRGIARRRTCGKPGRAIRTSDSSHASDAMREPGSGRLPQRQHRSEAGHRTRSSGSASTCSLHKVSQKKDGMKPSVQEKGQRSWLCVVRPALEQERHIRGCVPPRACERAEKELSAARGRSVQCPFK